MTAIIPFEFKAPAVALNRRRENSINRDAMLGVAGFPVLSIKGKVFTLVKDSERKVLTRVIDGEEEPISAISLAVVRANIKARVYYDKGYVEGESDGAKPKCFSNDGIAPDPSVAVADRQAAKCQMCPHAVWGTKVSRDGQEAKGTACSPNIRLAVADPNAPDTVFLLRVPPASRTNFSDAVKLADAHDKDYNQVVFRVAFDKDAPSPKLTFRPTGILSDATAAAVAAKWEDPTVLDIVGTVGKETPALPAPAPAAPPPLAPAEDEDDAPALGAAAEEPAPAPAPAPAARKTTRKATPAPAPAPAPAADDEDEGGGDLLSSLSALLNSKDD